MMSCHVIFFETTSNTELKDLQKTKTQQKTPKPNNDGWKTACNKHVKTFCFLSCFTWQLILLQQQVKSWWSN